MKKIVLFMLLMISLCASSQTISFLQNGLNYTVTDEGCVTVWSSELIGDGWKSDYNPLNGDAEIPSEVTYKGKNYRVTGIDGYAFSNCKSIKSISLPPTIKEIRDNAFDGCSNLKTINLPKSLTYIANYAFSGCNSLETMILPDEVEYISTEAFAGCTNLKTINMPRNLTIISNNVFSGCSSLVDISLPKGIEAIGQSAFEGCNALKTITIPENVTKIEEGVFSGCSNLSFVSLPNSLRTIENRAFYKCSSLPELALPPSVKFIGRNAFQGCESLEIIHNTKTHSEIQLKDIPKYYRIFDIEVKDNHSDGLLCCKTDIDKELLVCGYTNTSENVCRLPQNVKCTNDEDTIIYTVTSIGDNAFADCSFLEGIYIPVSISSISTTAFQGCTGLEKIFIPNGTLNSFKQIIPQEMHPLIEEIDTTGVYTMRFVFASKMPNTYESIEMPLPSSAPDEEYKNDAVEDEEKIYYVCEQMPKFPGEDGALAKFLAEHLHYPKDAAEAGIDGKVVVYIVIKKDGSVDDVQIARGIYPSLDIEAARVVKQMKFIPGRDAEGNPLNMYFAIPVTFSLTEK